MAHESSMVRLTVLSGVAVDPEALGQDDAVRARQVDYASHLCLTGGLAFSPPQDASSYTDERCERVCYTLRAAQ